MSKDELFVVSRKGAIGELQAIEWTLAQGCPGTGEADRLTRFLLTTMGEVVTLISFIFAARMSDPAHILSTKRSRRSKAVKCGSRKFAVEIFGVCFMGIVFNEIVTHITQSCPSVFCLTTASCPCCHH